MIVDTSLLIEFFRNKNKKDTFLYRISNRDLFVSAITCYEFIRGFNRQNEQSGITIMNQFEILDFNKPCAEEASQIYQYLKKENRLIDMADLLIGATALAYQLPLATLNIKDFEQIPNLELIRP
jgi:tRNA(fMet)-specific endonuclease VapC